MVKALTVALLLFMPTTIAATSPHFIGENGFGRYECTYNEDILNCDIHGEFKYAPNGHVVPFDEDKNITLGRMYTISMVYAFVALNIYNEAIPTTEITLKFKDGWNYNISYTSALGCVMLFDEIDKHAICFASQLTGGFLL